MSPRSTDDSWASRKSDKDRRVLVLVTDPDVRRWVDWVVSAQPGTRVFGFGESMGAAILLQSLDVESRFCAVVAEAPYATLREIAYDRLSERYHSGSWPGRFGPQLMKINSASPLIPS